MDARALLMLFIKQIAEELAGESAIRGICSGLCRDLNVKGIQEKGVHVCIQLIHFDV